MDGQHDADPAVAHGHVMRILVSGMPDIIVPQGRHGKFMQGVLGQVIAAGEGPVLVPGWGIEKCRR